MELHKRVTSESYKAGNIQLTLDDRFYCYQIKSDAVVRIPASKHCIVELRSLQSLLSTCGIRGLYPCFGCCVTLSLPLPK